MVFNGKGVNNCLSALYFIAQKFIKAVFVNAFAVHCTVETAQTATGKWEIIQIYCLYIYRQIPIKRSIIAFRLTSVSFISVTITMSPFFSALLMADVAITGVWSALSVETGSE